MKRLVSLLAVLAFAAPAHAAPRTPRCLDPAGWQKLANRIHAVVATLLGRQLHSLVVVRPR